MPNCPTFPAYWAPATQLSVDPIAALSRATAGLIYRSLNGPAAPLGDACGRHVVFITGDKDSFDSRSP